MSQKNLEEGKNMNFNQALTEHGIGAKTAVGYGYFEETQ